MIQIKLKRSLVPKFRANSKLKILKGDNESLNLSPVQAVFFSEVMSASPSLSISDIVVDLKAGTIAFNWEGKNVILQVMYPGAEGVNGDVVGVFFNNEYQFLRSTSMDVLDIGSNICDSSIYFALQGAKRVIALEPFPYSYKMARMNLELNGLTHRILLVNAGYGRDGVVNIDESIISSIGSKLSPVRDGNSVPIYSLRTLIDRYEIDSAFLKLDCEGYEYNLEAESDATLRRFPKIQIEYHNGIRGLRDRLESAGFEVYTTPSKKVAHLGYIYAALRNRLF